MPGAAAAAFIGAAWWLDVRRRKRERTRLHRTLIDLLLNALHAGEPHTGRHSRRVADLTDALASTYHLDSAERSRLRVAALLHDVGKLDDRFFPILHSCEPLSEEDRREIEGHPHEGADILRPLERIHPGITPIVEAHHESWNGEGYPSRLEGKQIPLEARILGVADVFDALTQPRPYHDPLEPEVVLKKIRKGAGDRFDPEVVRRLELPRVRERWLEIAGRGRREEERAERGSVAEAS